MTITIDMDAVRARLVDACSKVGFPAPSSGLARWADESLDVALAPRGSSWWSAGNAFVVEALEAAMCSDDVRIIETLLGHALDVVRRRGRPQCDCTVAGATMVDPRSGRTICCKCLARRG